MTLGRAAESYLATLAGRGEQLQPRLQKGRKSGPVFVTSRKARVPLSAADLDEHGHAWLSY